MAQDLNWQVLATSILSAAAFVVAAVAGTFRMIHSDEAKSRKNQKK